MFRSQLSSFMITLIFHFLTAHLPYLLLAHRSIHCNPHPGGQFGRFAEQNPLTNSAEVAVANGSNKGLGIRRRWDSSLRQTFLEQLVRYTNTGQGRVCVYQVWSYLLLAEVYDGSLVPVACLAYVKVAARVSPIYVLSSMRSAGLGFISVSVLSPVS